MKIKNSINEFWMAMIKLRDDYIEWDTFTPVGQSRYIYELGRWSGLLSGMRNFDDCRIVPSSFILFIVYAIYGICAIYTVFVRSLDGRFGEGVQCLSMLGLYVSVSFRIENFKLCN